jgi:hypothetical protein
MQMPQKRHLFCVCIKVADCNQIFKYKSWKMSERTTYENSYPFSWLDDVIEITLNPDKSNLKQIRNEILDDIQAKIPGEMNRVIQSVKGQAFTLYSNDQVKVIAGHYDQSIRVLQRQANYNQQLYPKTGNLFKTGKFLLSSLDELSKSILIRYGNYLSENLVTDQTKNDNPETILNKILCALSADQIGIILRSAFDIKLIVGNSFRKVCKAIAPYLSTNWKKDISWDVIRSHSGRPELRDKEIAIQTLQNMIEKIRGYR